MQVGTKSLLFGLHQFLLHPLVLAMCWWELYGFPWDPRLWFTFFLHDVGYVGKPNLDGKEGKTHPETGANMVGWLFGSRWASFCRYHSRFTSTRDNQQPSKLCVADKLAVARCPPWLYLLLGRSTGELYELMTNEDEEHFLPGQSEENWLNSVQLYCEAWAYRHRDLAGEVNDYD